MRAAHSGGSGFGLFCSGSGGNCCVVKVVEVLLLKYMQGRAVRGGR